MSNSPLVSFRASAGLLAGSLGLALLLLAASTLYSHLLLNVAQVQRLHGDLRPDDYTHALAAAPDDAHTRWQAAAAFAEAGNPVAASDLLLPLARQSTPNLDAARLFLAALLDTGRADEATQAYLAWKDPPALPPRTAAALVLTSLTRGPPLASPHLQALLAQALSFAPSAPEFQLLTEQMVDRAGFWTIPMGERVLATLTWQAAWPGSPASAGSVPHSSPGLARQTATLLAIAQDHVSMGAEMISNGGFEQNAACEQRFVQPCAPASWELSFMTTGHPWNRAAFVVARDTIQSGDADLRIDGLVVERLPTREAARAGLIYAAPITVTADHPYLLSFLYRTENTDDNAAALWLSADPAVFFAGDRWFAATAGQWRRVIIIAWNRSGKDATIQPILRSWSEGSVWFDDFSIRPLIVSTPVVPRAAIVQIGEP